MMAREGTAPIPFWLDLPLGEFCAWIESRNAVVREERERAEQARRERERKRGRR